VVSTCFRTKLSKSLITDASKLELHTAADLKIKYGTALRFGTVGLPSVSLLSTSVPAWKQTVTLVDTNTKSVVLDNGKEIVPYDTLILASGGVPRRLPIDGADLENVYTLRTIQDAQKIDSGTIFPVFVVG
jgi:apoptosis-inducing factor 3